MPSLVTPQPKFYKGCFCTSPQIGSTLINRSKKHSQFLEKQLSFSITKFMQSNYNRLGLFYYINHDGPLAEFRKQTEVTVTQFSLDDS